MTFTWKGASGKENGHLAILHFSRVSEECNDRPHVPDNQTRSINYLAILNILVLLFQIGSVG